MRGKARHRYRHALDGEARSHTNARAAERITRALENLRTFFEKQIEFGKVRGEFAQDLDSVSVASGLLGALAGIGVMARAAADTSAPPQVTDQALRLLDGSGPTQAHLQDVSDSVSPDGAGSQQTA